MKVARKSTLFPIIIGICVITTTFIIWVYNSYALRIATDPHPAMVYTTNTQEAVATSDLNCRYGISTSDEITEDWLGIFNAGWYLNFTAFPKRSLDSEFVHVVHIKQNKSQGQYLNSYSITPALTDADLGQLVDANPGALWILGNEPDVHSVQDDIYPEVYARGYHDAYSFIKQRDPSALIANGALSMATPGRLQYLDIVWDTYLEEYGEPMPVDVWTFHLYILSEKQRANGKDADGKIALGTDPALAKLDGANNPAFCPEEQTYCRAEHDSLTIFTQQVQAMRQWMKDHGQQHKPLLLSEFSILYPYVDDGGTCFVSDEYGKCFTPDRVNAFMDATLNYLETATDTSLGMPADNYRLVQQWLWFSMVTETEESTGASSDFLNRGTYNTKAVGDLSVLTPVGQNFYDHMQGQSTYVNLKATQAMPVAINTSGGSVTVTLTVEIYNNGTRSITTPFDVTFYKDAALTNPIGTVTVSPTLEGCARRSYTASVSWPGLTSGKYTYWVKVDSGDVIAETNELSSDNVLSGVVLVDPENVFLPMTSR
ncbi:MAG: hypothetical protein D6706_01190 [Chloroflexi bacterium]|nr:MAG: hypothetical protein D6706_01190 [Chloroflexota bacterium]